LWEKESVFLNLLFGNLQNDKDTQGYKIFFLKNILIQPNRFRPESKGGAKGGDDRNFLHAHSAIISKIITLNVSLKDLGLGKKTKWMEEQEKDISSTSLIQTWI
jgi:hypothetical protein